MAWLDDAIERLTSRPVCGYQRGGSPAVEPTALTALALMAAGRRSQAREGLDWLARVQSDDGSLGIDADTRDPCWPTGWAVLAWNTAARKIADAREEWSAAAHIASAWILATRGCRPETSDEERRPLGQDPALEGWPWVSGTYSWVEPTAINILALRSANQADHPRCREAVRLLLERQLPEGGWNYGNTLVFGNMLRTHVQPTGLVLAALAHETGIGDEVHRSFHLLDHLLSKSTTTASLCYALMGLAAHGVRPQRADDWLSAAFQRNLTRDNPPYHLALLVLAATKAELYAPPDGLPR